MNVWLHCLSTAPVNMWNSHPASSCVLLLLCASCAFTSGSERVPVVSKTFCHVGTGRVTHMRQAVLLILAACVRLAQRITSLHWQVLMALALVSVSETTLVCRIISRVSLKGPAGRCRNIPLQYQPVLRTQMA